VSLGGRISSELNTLHRCTLDSESAARPGSRFRTRLLLSISIGHTLRVDAIKRHVEVYLDSSIFLHPIVFIVFLSRVAGSRDRARLNDDTSDNLFEQQNEALLNQLGSKVTSLKSLSIHIGDTIKSSNKVCCSSSCFLSLSGC
jgi:hypothetical protein